MFVVSGGGQIPHMPDPEEKDPKQAAQDVQKESKIVPYGLSVKAAGVRSI